MYVAQIQHAKMDLNLKFRATILEQVQRVQLIFRNSRLHPSNLNKEFIQTFPQLL